MKNGYPAHLSEALLLRDLIYLLQGIDGRYVHFRSELPSARVNPGADDSWEGGGIGFSESAAHIITLPQRDLLLKLAELGWLYRRIQATILDSEQTTDSLPTSASRGMVAQALAYALKEELGLYYRIIAVIESRLSSDSSEMTLKALLLHLTPTLLRLRMSSALLTATKDLRGGRLVSVLHSYTDHGDPIVHLFTSNLLEKVSSPWFKTLASWIWEGELLDGMDEFFIALNSDMDHQSGQAAWLSAGADPEEEAEDGWKVWESKFEFRKDLVPSFISQPFARKVRIFPRF